jgi:hypothetical protein
MSGILSWYIDTVTQYPFQAAFVQFAILGMVGDWIAAAVMRKKFHYAPVKFALKMVGWGILGMFIKVGFLGMHGFTEAIFAKFHWPTTNRLFVAFCMSTFTNVIFGPQMMFFHRWEDNLMQRTKGYKGMDIAMKSLIFFWIPAHTLTFSIANHDVQVGLAAAWSLALGLILGIANRKK